MMDNMKILFVSPECVPYIKTGGLADVTGALPKALAKLGNQVRVILPLYRAVDCEKFGIKAHDLFPADIFVPIAGQDHKVGLFTTGPRADGVEYWFVDNEYFFGREGIYLDSSTGNDYYDNDERFIFFGRAVLEVAKALQYAPDLIHLNDWQSAMCAGYLHTLYRDDSFFKNSRTVFTIHNIGYQGHFSSETFPKLGVGDEFFAPGSPFEYWDHVNFLKIGITTSNLITAVSETYAEEIQSGNQAGLGMEGILTFRSDDLYGVLNGVDYDIWSPDSDDLIPFDYNINDISNKHKNKQALLHLAGLPERGERTPLIGMITRMVDQKGFDLINKVTDQLFALDIQFVLLGTGNENYHSLFEAMQEIYPRKVRAFLKFDNKVAHMIEAGADMFLMPSRYEPCGLNQMYSLRYGTVPIVRKTGGLADTIFDYNENPHEGNGFVFEEYDAEKMLDAIKRAIITYKDKNLWAQIQKRGMTADFSWEASARKYLEIYKRAMDKEMATNAHTPDFS